MKIIISPAKRMRYFESNLIDTTTPYFIKEAQFLASFMKTLSVNELVDAFKCSRKIASTTFDMYQDFGNESNSSPAILAYNGIQYLTMAPQVFNNDEIHYVNSHLYILSGLYGALRPYDSIMPYRLDFESNIKINNNLSLLNYWDSKIYDYVFKNDSVVLNLASNEYRKLISPFLKPTDQFIDVFFYEMIDHKIIEKSVYVKEARGAMVRFLASINANTIDDVKRFSYRGYHFNEELSNDKKIVFIRKENENVTD